MLSRTVVFMKKGFYRTVALFPFTLTLPSNFSMNPHIIYKNAVLPCPLRPITVSLYPGLTSMRYLVLTANFKGFPYLG